MPTKNKSSASSPTPVVITKIIKKTPQETVTTESAVVGSFDAAETTVVEVSTPNSKKVALPSTPSEAIPASSSGAAEQAATSKTPKAKTKTKKSPHAKAEMEAATLKAPTAAATEDKQAQITKADTTITNQTEATEAVASANLNQTTETTAVTTPEVSEVAATSGAESETTTDVQPKEPKTQPISEPTQHLQYRAIGLIKGKFVRSSQKNWEKGNLIASDGTEIDALILPRLKTVVRKYINLNEEHLWVVYPRTPGVNIAKTATQSTETGTLSPQQEREENTTPIVAEDAPAVTEDVTTTVAQAETSEQREETTSETTEYTGTPQRLLHLQIVGVWEPKTLHPNSNLSEPELQPDFFSVRGEVKFQNNTEGWLIVNIVQKQHKPEEEETKLRYLKLRLEGFLEQRAVKKFWDFQVLRQGEKLVIQEAKMIANFAKPKKPKFNKNKKNFKKYPPKGQRPPVGNAASEHKPQNKPQLKSKPS